MVSNGFLTSFPNSSRTIDGNNDFIISRDSWCLLTNKNYL